MPDNNNSISRVTNPELKALLAQRATVGDDREKFAAVMNTILENVATRAKLLMIIHVSPADLEKLAKNGGQMDPDTIFSIQMISSKDGKSFIPVFTDWAELRKWEPYKDAKVQALVAGFDDLYGFAKGSAGGEVNNTSGYAQSGVKGIVINPFSDNFGIPMSELDRIHEVKIHNTNN